MGVCMDGLMDAHLEDVHNVVLMCLFFFFQAEDGIRDLTVTGVQTCALPISTGRPLYCWHLGYCGSDCFVPATHTSRRCCVADNRRVKLDRLDPNVLLAR